MTSKLFMNLPHEEPNPKNQELKKKLSHNNCNRNNPN